MKGKGTNSKYIITRLFATDYFHYYSRPDLFAAYFFPFIAYGKNCAYSESELIEKITNIRANKHGNFYNYATQGFGNIALYEPQISFDYFYSRLSQYDDDKIRYFDVQSTDEADLESKTMKKDLRFVLDKSELFLKRQIPILESVKQELIQDLEEQENKYVLAKLLYYIVDSQHQLPNVESEVQKSIIDTAGFAFDFTPNICMKFRKHLDESVERLCGRLQNASFIQILCLDGISIFGDTSISRNDKGIYDELSKVFQKKTDLQVEIILSESDCPAYMEECRYQVSVSHLHKPKNILSSYSLDKLLQLKKMLPCGQMDLKTTRLYLPYALFIVEFADEKLDYIKLDMYSPLVDENIDRPSMYIWKKLNRQLYFHFKSVFENIWKNDECSRFIDG